MCELVNVKCLCGYYRRKYDVIVGELLPMFAGSGQKWLNTNQCRFCGNVKAEVMMSAVVIWF